MNPQITDVNHTLTHKHTQALPFDVALKIQCSMVLLVLFFVYLLVYFVYRWWPLWRINTKYYRLRDTYAFFVVCLLLIANKTIKTAVYVWFRHFRLIQILTLDIHSHRVILLARNDIIHIQHANEIIIYFISFRCVLFFCVLGQKYFVKAMCVFLWIFEFGKHRYFAATTSTIQMYK